MTSIKTIDDISARIEVQQRKLAQLKERKAKIEALARARQGKQDRADDTRRKILAGAVIMNAAKLGKISPLFLEQLLDDGLEKTADRKLFDLVPKAEVQTQVAAGTPVDMHD